MFSTISNNISDTKSEFISLTEHIKQENFKQQSDISYTTAKINEEFTKLSNVVSKNNEIQKDSFNNLLNNLQKNQNEINLISSHFKSLGEQVPEALNISLNALNSGLTSLTTKFRNDYKDMIEKNMKEINNGNR